MKYWTWQFAVFFIFLQWFYYWTSRFLISRGYWHDFIHSGHLRKFIAHVLSERCHYWVHLKNLKTGHPYNFSFHSTPKNMTRWYTGEVLMVGQKSQWKIPYESSGCTNSDNSGRVSRLEGGQAESGGMDRINRRRSWSRKKWEKAMEIRWFTGNLGGEATNMGNNTVIFSKLLMLMMISVGFDECFRIGNSSINWDVYEPLVWILPRRYHEEFLGVVWKCCLIIKGGLYYLASWGLWANP